MTVFSGVRCEKIKALHHLQIIVNHGKSLDSSRQRINKESTHSNYKYSQYSDKKDALNLTQNFGKIMGKMLQQNFDILSSEQEEITSNPINQKKKKF